jgi:hypothetical protein
MKLILVVVFIFFSVVLLSCSVVVAAFVGYSRAWRKKETPAQSPVVQLPPTNPGQTPKPNPGTPTPNPGQKGPPAKPVTNPGKFTLANIDYKPVGDFKKDVLGTINALRAIRNVSEPKPQKPIVPLTWDPELEAAACVHADINAKGSMHHPGVVMKGWEVIAWHDPATQGGIFAWWNEHVLKPNPAYPNVPTAWHCDPGNTACSDTGHESGELATGHYAFISHSDATRLGCCTSTAGTWAPLVCQGR